MRDTLYLSAAFVMTYLAFAGFALAQKRHWQAVTGTRGEGLASKRTLKTGGIVCFVVGCAIVLWRDGIDYGLLLWVTQLTAAAAGVVGTLALRPRCLRPLAAIAARTSTFSFNMVNDREDCAHKDKGHDACR
jgi:hypothetical protein